MRRICAPYRTVQLKHANEPQGELTAGIQLKCFEWLSKPETKKTQTKQ